MRYDGPDEVCVWMFFTVENNVWTQLSNAEGSLAFFFSGYCCPDAVWTLGLLAQKGRDFAGVVPRAYLAAQKASQTF